jgi:hypothetical protein
VLERDRPDNLGAGILGAAQSALARLDQGGLQQQPGGRWRAQLEGERAVGADGDVGGDGGAGVDVCGAGVEFLFFHQLLAKELLGHGESD